MGDHLRVCGNMHRIRTVLIYVIAAALTYTKGTGLSTILLHGGQSRSCMDTVTELRVNQSHQKSSITSQGVFIYAHASVSNNGTINWSTMGPLLSIFIRNTEDNNMSCDLMNNKTTMNNSKTALLHIYIGPYPRLGRS